ncbi:PAS domain S-box protein [uncultured Desulfosarcina sp.]|uniref:PAS domain S-box protein n=1 Tax=uncultured Desulfosarcina sp. TaxID=218289 RepID=UPI0029C6347D|nr:PAS domain S-box protein [uncultured Desulfosarcina sp.]
MNSAADTMTANEQRNYRDLVENLNDVVYTTDRNAVVTYVSPNIVRLSGFKPDEVVGKNFVEFVHPDDLSDRMDQFVKILDGYEQATEYRFLIKTGEIKWVRTSTRPIIKDGQVTGVQGILVDITDRKEIEEALRRSEEKYRIVVQHANDAIFVLQDQRIKFMNPSACEILGDACSNISERSFLEFVHPDDRPMIQDRYKRRMRGEKLSNRIYFKMKNINGDFRDIELNALLIVWEDQPAILCFGKDTTVQKMTEAQLRNSQRMEALGTLAGGIAHNFNNLLMGIHGNASLCRIKLDDPSPVDKYLDKINILVESGAKLTKQLLHYARGGDFQVGRVNLNTLVKEVSETVTATKKRIRIQLTLSETIPDVKADKGQIEQVLINLVLNAADAMPEGGDVSIETTSVEGREINKIASLSDEQTYVRLTVSDSGHGIPVEIQDRIFEPFFTTKGLERGTGLGLSTAYGIVRNHNGEITVESEIDKGAVFSVYLPAVAENAAQR